MSTIEHATHSHNDSPEGNPSNLTITTNVCHPCKDLLDNWDDHDCNHNGVPHHRSIEDLEHSAMNECSICYQLWRARPVPSTLRQAQNEITELAPLNVYSKLRVRYYLGMSQLILEFHNPRSNFSSTKIIAFEVDMIHTEDALEDTNTVATPSITSTRDCMLLVAEWLRICRSEHDSCHKLNKDFVPTRLIGLDAEHPYILDKADTPGSVPYTTLSHCWGNNDFATLKSDSLMAFKQEIPQEAISVVFEDAFYITRVLGFKYIWIDALCIVQDDVEDWRIETSKVNDIFGNSKLNIAASGAASGHESCFIQRPAHWRAQVELYGDIREIVPSNLTHRMLKSMPLESRGWALQERMLSRRTVHFTSTEMVWECCAGMKSESFPGRLPSICTLDIDKMCQGAVEVSDWPKIVEEFTRRELTQPTDKLVAIAGLARKFHAKTNDQYIAGMWRQDLTFQLCWSVYGERENKGLYVAPSWSWASIPNGAVNTSPAPIDVFSWDDLLSSDISVRNTHSMVQVVDIILQYAGEDVFGALEGAELILEVEALAPVSHHHGDGNIRICNEEVKCDFSFDYKMDDDIESLQETYALSILSSKDNGELWGLLLTREVARRGTYRRIGLCQFGPAEAQAFQRVMNEGLWNNVRSECYLDADLRSIRLI